MKKKPEADPHIHLPFPFIHPSTKPSNDFLSTDSVTLLELATPVRIRVPGTLNEFAR